MYNMSQQTKNASKGSKLYHALQNSVLYRTSVRIYQISKRSAVVRLLNNERFLAALVGVFMLFSLFRVLQSGMHVSIKFMSFLVLFVLLAALTWQYTEPLTD